MAKYVLCKYEVSDPDSPDFEEYGASKMVWILCKVFSKPMRVEGFDFNKAKKFRIKKIIKASNDFNSIYNTERCDDLLPVFTPHLEKDGRLYIGVHFTTENPITGTDTALEFEKDEDALLYAEAGL